MRKKNILMAVSSSGGHIYPALALLEKLNDKKEPSSFGVHFVYKPTTLSKKILQDTNYPCYEISLGGFAKGQNFFKKLKTLFQLPFSFFKALFIVYKTKADIILGTGGSVTVPVILAGFVMRKKIAVWEANTSTGLANKILASFVPQVFTVFPQVKSLPEKKQIQSAYPLRKQIYQSQKKELAFPEDKFKILILGGSQGSVFLNQKISQALEDFSWRQDFFICHQTGDKSYNEISQKYQSLKGVSVFPFLKDIQNYYQECDLIFSRAGSGAIAEIAYFKKALVLIPLTHSAGGHQFKNALTLSSKNCVEMIPEKDFNASAFKNKILELVKNKEKRDSLGLNLNRIYQTEDKITKWLEDNI